MLLPHRPIITSSKGCHLFTFTIGDGGLERSPQPTGVGVSPLETFWNSLCDLVHFCAIWWQLSVGRWTRYICNFATEVEPICQLQSPHDRTAVLSLLSNEHALKSRTFSVPGMVLPGRGTTWHKSGTSREIRDIPGNPGRVATLLPVCSNKVYILHSF